MGTLNKQSICDRNAGDGPEHETDLQPRLVNSFSIQFALKSIRSHFGQVVLIFRSICTHKIFLRSIRTHWSIRSNFSQFVRTLKSTNFEGNIERKQK